MQVSSVLLFGVLGYVLLSFAVAFGGGYLVARSAQLTRVPYYPVISRAAVRPVAHSRQAMREPAAHG